MNPRLAEMIMQDPAGAGQILKERARQGYEKLGMTQADIEAIERVIICYTDWL